MSHARRIRFRLANANDAGTLAALHTAVANDLTRVHGRGPWSTKTSEKGVLLAMHTSQVFRGAPGGCGRRDVSAGDQKALGNRYELLHEMPKSTIFVSDGCEASGAMSRTW
jgi:hypothetical protein